MPLTKGDRYFCTSPDCGCEVVVTKSASSGKDQPPRCCCGKEMRKAQKPVTAPHSTAQEW